MKRLILKIYGQVQGVGFRYNTQKRARELDLTGYVNNNLDRTVSVLAEGSEENLQIFLAWCYNGVKGAVVDRVDEKWFNFGGNFSDFEIR